MHYWLRGEDSKRRADRCGIVLAEPCLWEDANRGTVTVLRRPANRPDAQLLYSATVV